MRVAWLFGCALLAGCANYNYRFHDENAKDVAIGERSYHVAIEGDKVYVIRKAVAFMPGLENREGAVKAAETATGCKVVDKDFMSNEGMMEGKLDCSSSKAQM